MQPDGRSSIRVGLLVLVALAVLAGGVFLIGEQSNLFRPKVHYQVRFASVNGLQEGNPVQLNGVHVGSIEAVLLPEDPSVRGLQVTVAVDARYRARIRTDSTARIKTLGLLGDKFIELSSGSPERGEVPAGGEISTAQGTDVEHMLASGEGVVENIVAVSASLKDILERMERGDGLLGELMQPRAPDEPGLADTLNGLNQAVAALTEGFQTGAGPIPRMLHDRDLGDKMAMTLSRLERLSAELENDGGLLQALLRDTEMRDQMAASVRNLERASQGLATTAAAFEHGDGLLPKLLNDAELAESMSRNLEQSLERLNTLAGKLTEGDGTVAKLLNDPSIYDALNDVVVGVDRSKFLRWLIRNRQKSGIKKRYQDTRAEMEEAGEQPEPLEPRKHGRGGSRH